MKKKIRLIIFIFVILLVFLIIMVPIVLNSFIDKEKLKTTYNQNSFDSFVLNIKICLANNGYPSNIDNSWLIEKCENISRYNCEKMIYENKILTLKNCEVNGQLFSYDNGKIYLN